MKLSGEFGEKIVAQSNEIIDLLETQLKEYFEGKRKSFSIPLNPIGTDFQKKVWNHLLGVDYGKTISYKEQVIAMGDLKALRAVASTNGANNIPIVISCHAWQRSQGSTIKSWNKLGKASVPARKIKKLWLKIGLPFPGPMPKTQLKAKHVENTFAACLDEGSSPSNSTIDPNLSVRVFYGAYRTHL